MSQYQTLKTQIQQNIKQNGEGAIRGDILQTQLLDMINALGAGYQFMGVATPTNPGTAQTPDYKCFYIATTPGTYTNLGELVVADGEVALLKYDSSWTKVETGIATAAQVSQLGQKVTYKRYLFEGDTQNGYITPNGAQAGNWDTGLISEYIPVKSGDEVKNYAASDAGALVIAFYDSNYAFIPAGKIEGASASMRLYTSTAPQDGFVRCYTDKYRVATAWTDSYILINDEIAHNNDIEAILREFTNVDSAIISGPIDPKLLGDYYVNAGTIATYIGQHCFYVKVFKGEILHFTFVSSGSFTLRYGLFNSKPQSGASTTSYGQKSVNGTFDIEIQNDGYFAFSFNSSSVTSFAITATGLVPEVVDTVNGFREEINNKVSKTPGKNLFNKDSSEIVTGYYLAISDGSPSVNVNFEYIYIPAQERTKYTLSGFSNNAHICFYNGDTFISGKAINITTGNTVESPANTTKIGLSVRIADVDAIQLEVGQEATPYAPYMDGVGTDSINYGAVTANKLGTDVAIKKTIKVGATREYTSILAALKAGGDNCRVVVDSGVYDIEAEYKDFYGSDFFSTYPMDGYHSQTDNFYAGLWLSAGVELVANGLVTLTFPYPDGLRQTDVPTEERTRENFDPVAQYFSILNTTHNNLVEGIDIALTLNNCRYHIHDDYAYKPGMNVFRNIHLSGISQKLTAFGCGMGTQNIYLIENCYIDCGSGYSISYHNNSGSGKNKLIIKNTWCSGNIMARMYGTSTEKTQVVVSGCKANAIVLNYVDQSNYPNENMELIAWNNITTS